MFADNDWYGHKKVLLKYCNIKRNLPIYGTLQHGYNVDYKSNKRFKASKYLKNAWYYSWNNFLAKNKKIKAVPIGSPFIYLDILNKDKNYKQKGTLVFPSHSNPEYPQTVDHIRLIKFTKKNFIKPHKVSLYYTDFLNPNIVKIYKKNGFKILCNGHRGDQNFLNKVYKNISQSEFILCTDFGTPTFYSMYLKKKVAIFEHDENNKDFYSYTSKNYQFFKKKYKYFYNKKLYSLSWIKKGFEFSKQELGYKYIIKNPEELMYILGLKNIFKVTASYMIKLIYDLKFGVALRGEYKRKMPVKIIFDKDIQKMSGELFYKK